jgi:formylglycine-generating enzyme required for sulfatase activity
MNNFLKNNNLLTNRNILSPISYNSANYNKNANWNGSSTTGNITSVGSNGGSSAYGTYDQTGNVNEWNDRIFVVNEQNNRGIWGGAFNSLPVNIVFTRRSFHPQSSNGSSDIGFRIVSLNDPLNYNSENNQFLNIGDINNTSYFDTTIGSIGSVNYQYKIMKYTVTNSEYVLFLNSIAKTDTNLTYNANMNLTLYGGITRSGTSGNFLYVVKNNFANKPVNYVSWYRAARFANWLSNGRPSGPQNNTTTEDGAYTLTGNTGVPVLNSINPNTGLIPTYRLPSEDEWFKAAYYKGNGTNSGYWTYATQSNTTPASVNATLNGDGIL